MKVLVACEESQTVCKAFRKLGHEAYSCDIQDCSGGHPEWHIKGDVIPLLSQQWDLIIAHPPCTFLANSGVRWLYKDESRWAKMRNAAEFFNEFVSYGMSGKKIAIENPIMHKYAKEIIQAPYSQIIQPYQFGHAESKATCLWLFGVPKLTGTNNVKSIFKNSPKKEGHRIHFASPGKERAKLRSKTFQGIADAFADQYSLFFESGLSVKEFECLQKMKK